MTVDSIPFVYGAFLVWGALVLVFSGRRGRFLLIWALVAGGVASFVIRPSTVWSSPLLPPAIRYASRDFSPIVPMVFQIVYFPLYVLAVWAVLLLFLKVLELLRPLFRNR